ncbi:MAG: heme lyase CcmF/NrfE family subunit [Gemmatimonadetes bacterium]|nr:heme lyase CcmF/NrfE family subunit [Gemmatimonadota bacterium]
MTRLLGLSACAVALALAVFGAAAAVMGARLRRPELVRSAIAAAYANFALLLVANLAMVYALVTRDFSISYVAQVGSRATPLFYTIISLWGALDGSILFWGLVLSGYTALAVRWSRAEAGAVLPYALAILLAVGSFFYLLLVGPANPFGRMFPVPVDGPGPNPLLQNHLLMAIHPPLLYLGYVGMTVPFAFATGALLAGGLDDRWIRLTRRWTLTAWGFLSLAIIAGMWWSYEVLGWGGYWAWDPVENASFMPWLTATAFLHSAMVEERRGLLRVWNVSLVVATFVLTILGTFLTRSGILSSVHAFTQGTIGFFFLAFIAVVLLFSLALVAGRSTELRGTGRLEGVVSRDTAFLLNNLLFTAFTFTVLLGTLFPLAAEAVRGVKVSVGAPFFNRMTIPLCAALLFLVGVGPALPWGRPERQLLRRKFVPPFLALGLVAGTLLALGVRAPFTVAAFAFAGFALTANLGEFADGTRARRRAHGEAPPRALVRLVRSNPRRYGGYLAHLGVLLIALGITASSSFRTERQATLRPGQTLAIAGHVLRFERLWARQEPQRFVVAADLTVLRGSTSLGRLDPRLNYYAASAEPVATPAVRSRARADLYVTLLAFEQDGSSATFHAYVQPLVIWIWLGGAVIAAGALLALSQRRERRSPGGERLPAAAQAEAR